MSSPLLPREEAGGTHTRKGVKPEVKGCGIGVRQRVKPPLRRVLREQPGVRGVADSSDPSAIVSRYQLSARDPVGNLRGSSPLPSAYPPAVFQRMDGGQAASPHPPPPLTLGLAGRCPPPHNPGWRGWGGAEKGVGGCWLLPTLPHKVLCLPAAPKPPPDPPKTAAASPHTHYGKGGGCRPGRSSPPPICGVTTLRPPLSPSPPPPSSPEV